MRGAAYRDESCSCSSDTDKEEKEKKKKRREIGETSRSQRSVYNNGGRTPATVTDDHDRRIINALKKLNMNRKQVRLWFVLAFCALLASTCFSCVKLVPFVAFDTLFA